MLRFSTFVGSLVLLLYSVFAPTFHVQAQPLSPSPMNEMDHGPFISSTISTDPMSTRSIVVHKGIAVKLGSEGDAVMVFDTDLLRVASAWTGGLLKWYPARDGLQEFPSPDGFIHFSTSQRPGWSIDRKFTDPRPWGYGPLPRTLGSYQGLYLHGDKVVFSYTIGQADVLESPGFVRVENQPIFTRTFKLGKTANGLSVQVTEAPDGSSTTLEQIVLSPTSGYVEIRSGNQSRLVGHRGLPANAKWRLIDHHLVLDLPPLDQALDFELAIGPALQSSAGEYMITHLESKTTVTDLRSLQEPGSSNWEVIETEIGVGTESGPFVVDELTLPTTNPWNSFLRFSGVDFLSDGRAVVSSLSGEVWIVDGLGEGSGDLRWTRFATGLNQPMGVKVVNDRIYVTCRDQINLLHDRNGDGEADFYENFNNDVMAATNFHAFTLNLDTDSKGNFYFAKATPWPPVSRIGGVKAEITPHHGVLFRMPPDGSKLDIIATGLRNPNGLSIGPNDEILYSDNEGNWVPTSKVHKIVEGGFHGFMHSAHRDPLPTNFEKPILWVPHFVDNSPSTPIFIDSPTWPEELQGQLLLTSYGRGTLSLVLKEEVEGQWQGAHLTLPLRFQSGTIHGRFHQDGHLYIAGLTSWQSVGHGGDWGSFHRVRYTGRPLHLPVAVNTKKGGLELRFSDALEPDSATDPQNYSLSLWTYPWTSQYGTRGKIYSMTTPGDTVADPVVIQSIQLSEDRKTVLLEIPELRQDLAQKTLGVLSSIPDMIEASMGLVMAIDYRLRSADGAEMKHVIHKTIHRVAGDQATTTAQHGSTEHVSKPKVNFAKELPSLAPMIADGTRVVDVRSTGIALSYDVTEIKAKPGERIVIRFVNASEMAHNIVVVKTEVDINPVGIAAISAQADEFVPKQEMDRILAASRLAYPGDTVFVEFTAPTPGVYPYICTFSGHFTLMQGRIIVEP
ncbi:MAG: plastocyanin/azurin family copper-binding protein [Verrucomicrobia bacterium]|nr:plastocyanin/azurin family copper-binding protein [Verrucomicrobiota bacterium]MDA1068442.1 plastocyanin/azurin family copper-binding protein [Verrucomicrobiota bacterium]